MNSPSLPVTGSSGAIFSENFHFPYVLVIVLACILPLIRFANWLKLTEVSPGLITGMTLFAVLFTIAAAGQILDSGILGMGSLLLLLSLLLGWRLFPARGRPSLEKTAKAA